MWNYLNFIFFIKRQDRDDDDGLELFVRNMMMNKDVSWFPSGRAMVLQGDETQITEQDLILELGKIKETINSAFTKNAQDSQSTLADLTDGLEESLQKISDRVNNLKNEQNTA